MKIVKNIQYVKFCLYGFLKNLRFFDAFFILFLVEKGQTYTQIGILYAIREIVLNLLEVPLGIFADTYGRKKALVCSFLCYIFSFTCFYLGSDFALFLVAFALYGVADAFRSGTHKGIIIDYLRLNNWENQKISYYGHTRSWSQKGSAISSLVAGFIVFYSGRYQSIFLYSIVPYIINLLLIISYPKELDLPIKRTNNKRFDVKTNVKSLFAIIKQPKVFRIINTSAVYSAYLKAIKDYIQPLMVSVAVIMPILSDVAQKNKNGIIIGCIYFVIYLATSRASRVSAKFVQNNNRNVPYITLMIGFVLGVALGLFYFSGFVVMALITFVGIYIIENIRKPILTGYVADNVPNEILVSVISAESLLQTIITAVIAFVFGVFADLWGIGISFVVVSSFLILSTLFINRSYFNVKGC